jgi:hypothetical protein
LPIVNDLLHREIRTCAFVPGDHERREAALGGPRVVADHGDRIVRLDDLAHAGDPLRVGVVDAAKRATKHRTRRDGRVDHVRDPHVEAEYGRAIHLLRRIEPLDRGADDLEVLRIL